MRPALLTLAFSMFVQFTEAQKFEIGLSGGLAFNSEMRMTSEYMHLTTEQTPAHSGPAFSLRAAYNMGRWQAGISFDRRSATYRTYYFTGCICYGVPSDMTPQQQLEFQQYITRSSYHETHSVSAYYPVQLFLNRKVSLNRYELTGGITGGYIFIPDLKSGNYVPDDGSKHGLTIRDPFNKNGYSGYCAGMQAGCTYSISKHVGINANISATYQRLHQGVQSQSYFFSYPVTAGIVYKL